MPQSFFMFSGPTSHIHFVISEKNSEGNSLVVNASTYRGMRSEDTTCILQPGEHPFIKAVSYIPYQYAREMSWKDIQKKNPVEDVSADLYEKLRDGARRSDFFPRKLLKYVL